MPREKFKTLTEQMFYILLCLKDECYGIDIFDKIAHITEGKVTVGSGTMYTLLEQFLDAGMIREVRVEGRRRSYILTNKGKEMLEAEMSRHLGYEKSEGSDEDNARNGHKAKRVYLRAPNYSQTSKGYFRH